ncbi:MAG: hypothetical protein FRX49_00095 [Trebouxia sp. A1-2]|nr:MAG: hypothetical protein FRX49_00095 [Trebouxia sp. A1-2]
MFQLQDIPCASGNDRGMKMLHSVRATLQHKQAKVSKAQGCTGAEARPSVQAQSLHLGSWEESGPKGSREEEASFLGLGYHFPSQIYIGAKLHSELRPPQVVSTAGE